MFQNYKLGVLKAIALTAITLITSEKAAVACSTDYNPELVCSFVRGDYRTPPETVFTNFTDTCQRDHWFSSTCKSNPIVFSRYFSSLPVHFQIAYDGSPEGVPCIRLNVAEINYPSRGNETRVCLPAPILGVLGNNSGTHLLQSSIRQIGFPWVGITYSDLENSALRLGATCWIKFVAHTEGCAN